MGAYAFEHGNVGFDRTEFVFRRKPAVAELGIRIGYLGVAFLDAVEHFLGTVNDPHRFAAIFDDLHFARRELGDIDFDGRARGFGAFGRKHAAGERHGRRHCRDAAHHAGGDQQKTAFTLIHFLIRHRISPLAK